MVVRVILLVAFILVLAALIISLLLLPWYALPVEIIGAILAISIIGAFQLRQDGQINETNFLKLMALSFQIFAFAWKQGAKPRTAHNQY